MGNRCVITDKSRKIGVYLHWNGGYDSVRAFLRYCELQGYREPDQDSYGWARLCQVIGNFFGGGDSVGIFAYSTDEREEPGDNGIFVIKGWKVVENIRFEYKTYDPEDDEKIKIVKSADKLEAEYKNGYDLQEFLESIDKDMPEQCRLGDFLKARQIPISDVQKGQMVFSRSFDGWTGKPCLGFGDGRIVNGIRTQGLPFADFLNKLERYERWGFVHEPETVEDVMNNPNSYLEPNYSNNGMCWAIPVEKSNTKEITE